MGLISYIVSSALLASAAAQVATYSNGGHALSVNVPSDTASSGSGSIYFQISAPSGTQWTAFGQGNRMAGANMFVIYSSGDGNVTLSPRSGTGHVMPQHNGDAQVSLLDGSGIASDGSLVANIRCDNCGSWSGGSMSFTDSASSWIYASKSGDALDDSDASASISQHSEETTFSLDLTSGTGGSSTNPFVAAQEPAASGSATQSGATASQTGAAATSGTATPTNGVSNPVASSGSDSSSGSDEDGDDRPSTDTTATLMNSHGIIMSVLFLALLPFFSLTLYLPTAIKVRYIHAPLQMLAVLLLIVGMALGIIVGQRMNELDGYHQIIGFIIVACLVLFQPAMGIYQHLHYCKTGQRSTFGYAHRWLGRAMLILGIINGGLGWNLGGNTSAYIPYAVVAAIVFLIYLGVLGFAWYRSGNQSDIASEKISPQRSYEMQPNRQSKHRRLSSDEINNNPSMYQQQQQQSQPGSTGYSTNSRR